jgi:PmbA protein
MRSEADSHAVLAAALDAAGTPESDAVLVSTDRNITRFANSSIHQNMSEISAVLSLRVIDRGRAGVASTTSFDSDSLRAAAALALEAARRSEPMPNFGGLYRGGEPAPELDTWRAPTAAVTPADKGRAVAAMFDRGRPRSASFAGAFATSCASMACANTSGVRRYARFTVADTTVIALRSSDSGYATAVDRDLGRVDILALGDEAVEKATLAAGHNCDIEPGAYDVILEPPAVAEVCEWLNLIAFTGQSFEDGSSFLAGNLGGQVTGAAATIADDAVDNGFLPFPFDAEGMPKRRVPLIERGIARTPMVDKAYSDRLNVPPTAGATSLGGSEHGAANCHPAGIDRVDTSWHLDHPVQLRQRPPGTARGPHDRHHPRRDISDPGRQGCRPASEPPLDAVDPRGILEHRRRHPRTARNRSVVEPARRNHRPGHEDSQLAHHRGSEAIGWRSASSVVRCPWSLLIAPAE